MVKRQAVVLIHGIGEQRPMDTLRGFVDAVWRYDTAIHDQFATSNAGVLVWSKPDNVSESFELRRLTTPQNVAGIRTDFFEFYWQHLLQGTTYGHLVAWARSLLLRRPGSVPRQLKPVYWLLLVGLAVAAGLAVYAGIATAGGHSVVPPWVSAIASVVLLPIIGVVLKNIVGDAARYLHVAPANVQCRHAIRQAGIKLLDTLHAREYDRIIVVGHSLGSVIGYDMLTSAWPAYHRDPPDAGTAMDQLEALEEIARQKNPPIADLQACQRAYAEELAANGGRWRVTDFVTLGSPLAHAEVLLAANRDVLRSRFEGREFPTCPPTPETVIRQKKAVQRFSFELGGTAPKGYRVPHHAAVFAPTRWTNVYFPCRMILGGDLIGGPLREVLGNGIRDVEVTTSLRLGLLSHTLYWTLLDPDMTPGHITTLREVLDLTDNKGASAAPAPMAAP